jgi:hypothetical protein
MGVHLARLAHGASVDAEGRGVALRAPDREDDVVRGEFGSVVELDALPQVEAPDGRRDLRPALRQARDDLHLLALAD